MPPNCCTSACDVGLPVHRFAIACAAFTWAAELPFWSNPMSACTLFVLMIASWASRSSDRLAKAAAACSCPPHPPERRSRPRGSRAPASMTFVWYSVSPLMMHARAPAARSCATGVPCCKTPTSAGMDSSCRIAGGFCVFCVARLHRVARARSLISEVPELILSISCLAYSLRPPLSAISTSVIRPMV